MLVKYIMRLNTHTCFLNSVCHVHSHANLSVCDMSLACQFMHAGFEICACWGKKGACEV